MAGAFALLLLVLLPVAAVVYIVWDYKRRTAVQKSASAGRMHELLGTAAAVPPAPGERTEPVATPAPAPQSPHYVTSERALSPAQTLLFFLLRTGLPDAVVLARANLGCAIEVAPGLPERSREIEARRLAGLPVDFVIADRSMKPLAIVLLAVDGGRDQAVADRAAVRSRAAAAGIRYVELDPRALPKKESIRAVVLGAAGGVSEAAGGAKPIPSET